VALALAARGRQSELRGLALHQRAGVKALDRERQTVLRGIERYRVWRSADWGA
jgi:hypothetical protein